MEPQTAKTVGALVGTRTRDLILTKNVLCQLSYKGLTAGGADTPGTRVARAQKAPRRALPATRNYTANCRARQGILRGPAVPSTGCPNHRGALEARDIRADYRGRVRESRAGEAGSLLPLAPLLKSPRCLILSRGPFFRSIQVNLALFLPSGG